MQESDTSVRHSIHPKAAATLCRKCGAAFAAVEGVSTCAECEHAFNRFIGSERGLFAVVQSTRYRAPRGAQSRNWAWKPPQKVVR